MNVGKWTVFGLAVAMFAMVGQARAEHSRPSQETLNQMGLGGMVVMSDADASSVRGQGFQGGGSSVRVFGNSFATVNKGNGTAHSQNGYSVQGRHFAAGANGSVAGVIKIKGRHISSTTFFAGGFSAGVGF